MLSNLVYSLFDRIKKNSSSTFELQFKVCIQCPKNPPECLRHENTTHFHKHRADKNNELYRYRNTS